MHVEERAARRPSLVRTFKLTGMSYITSWGYRKHLTISCKDPLKTTVAIIALLVQW